MCNGIERNRGRMAREIPEEVMEEILSRLDVKSLLRFRCVSRSWCRLICSHRFIKTHLQNLKQNPNPKHRGFIQNLVGPKKRSLHSLLKESTSDPTSLDDPEYSSSRYYVNGCCDGLLCIMDMDRGFFSLWNPATRAHRELPELADITVPNPAYRWFVCHFGFGRDEASGAHKLFVNMLNFRTHERKITIYSSDSDSWKSIESTAKEQNIFARISQYMGNFVRGKLHWNRRSSIGHYQGDDYIVTFDLRSEALGRMEAPEERKGSCGSWLGEMDGCLSMVFRYNQGLNVWVMKESSWVKMAEVPFVYKRGLWEAAPLVQLLWIGEEGEVLLTYNSYFLVYYPRQNLLLPLNEFRGFKHMHFYVETLLSPHYTI